LIGVLLVLSIAFVLPFVEFFLLAVLLAYIVMPIQKRLEQRIRAKVAAAIVVSAAAIVVVLPLVYVVRETTAEAVALLRAVREGAVTFEKAEEAITDFTGMRVDIGQIISSTIQDVPFDSFLTVFDTLTHVLIGSGLTVFLLYYFLTDRKSFFEWLRRTVPLSDAVQDRLFEELDNIIGAVLVGHVLVALVQGLLAGLALVVTGVPNAMLWTVVMTVLSLLPIVGSFLVWGPAAVYLFLNGQTVMAVGLFVWGAIVVGISDDYLRPIIVDRYAHVNPSVIIIGVLGGLYVIGFMGIFFGPVVIGALRATLDVFRDQYVIDN
jgi:predicted PurR-regulated permease PerM